MSMELPKRKEIRLKEYDYSTNGGYFVTICTKDKRHLLSTIRVGDGLLDIPYAELTAYGQIVEQQFEIMNELYSDIKVKHYVIMPNHIHFIVEIVKHDGTSGRPSPTRSNSLISKYVGTFKRFTNKKRNFDIWQRSYYDHIIRNEADYLEKQKYIENNSARWAEDEYFIQ